MMEEMIIVLSSQAYLLPAICLLVLLILILFILSFIEHGKKGKKYVEAFSSSYEKDKNVMTALENSMAAFKPKSKEAQAIKKGIFYISHSILHDYPTAFSMIEKKIKGKRVKQLHKEVVEQERNKKNSILLLTTTKS